MGSDSKKTYYIKNKIRKPKMVSVKSDYCFILLIASLSIKESLIVISLSGVSMVNLFPLAYKSAKKKTSLTDIRNFASMYLAAFSELNK